MSYLFRIFLFFFDKKKKSCNHGFTPSEVVNLKIDPTCVHCGRTLSEISKK